MRKEISDNPRLAAESLVLILIGHLVSASICPHSSSLARYLMKRRHLEISE